MLSFHQGQIKLAPTSCNKPSLIVESFCIFIEEDSPKKLDYYRELFTKKTNQTVVIDSHAFDVVMPILKDHEAFSLYLMLYRMSDRDLVFTTVKDLTEKLSLDYKSLLKSLSILEENLLIKIEGNKLLKITLNKKWF